MAQNKNSLLMDKKAIEKKYNRYGVLQMAGVGMIAVDTAVFLTMLATLSPAEFDRFSTVPTIVAALGLVTVLYYESKRAELRSKVSGRSHPHSR